METPPLSANLDVATPEPRFPFHPRGSRSGLSHFPLEEQTCSGEHNLRHREADKANYSSCLTRLPLRVVSRSIALSDTQVHNITITVPVDARTKHRSLKNVAPRLRGLLDLTVSEFPSRQQ